MIVGVIVAAGSGTRLGAGIPKALVTLDNKPLITYSLETWNAQENIDQIIVVAPASHYEVFQELCAPYPRTCVIIGGAERSDSVAAALQKLYPNFPEHSWDDDHSSTEGIFFLIHDAARALTPPEVIHRVIAALLAGNPAVIPVLPVIDTIKQIDCNGYIQRTIPRSDLVSTQTPQGFAANVVLAAYRYKDQHPHTDDAGLVEKLGIRITTVTGDPRSVKITTPHDLALAEYLIAQG